MGRDKGRKGEREREGERGDSSREVSIYGKRVSSE